MIQDPFGNAGGFGTVPERFQNGSRTVSEPFWDSSSVKQQGIGLTQLFGYDCLDKLKCLLRAGKDNSEVCGNRKSPPPWILKRVTANPVISLIEG